MTEHVQITIVGTGCIGASIGLALRQAAEPLAVVGHDKDSRNAGAARKLKAVDRTDWNLVNACENADLIVLALPLGAIEDTFRAIAPYLKEGCVLTDTCDLKEPVLAFAAGHLPDKVSFVGGDPLVSSAAAGPGAARVDLFESSLYCVTPSPTAHPDAVNLVSSLVTLLGAQPFYLDAAEHDGLMAGTAQLPQVLALALWHRAVAGAGWRDMRKLTGTAFDTMGALLGEDGDALARSLLSNREHLLPWLDTYLDQLGALRGLIADGTPESLSQIGEQVLDARRQWVLDRRHHFSEDMPMPPIEKPNLLHQILPRRLLEKR
jgi:prephenate dehydrogenase